MSPLSSALTLAFSSRDVMLSPSFLFMTSYGLILVFGQCVLTQLTGACGFSSFSDLLYCEKEDLSFLIAKQTTTTTIKLTCVECVRYANHHAKYFTSTISFNV